MHFISEDLENYVANHSQQEPELLVRLSKETHQKILQPRMLSGHFQGRVLSMLSKIINPKAILEIGTYTGYAALCLAEGLQENGTLDTIDINDELEEIQKKYFLYTYKKINEKFEGYKIAVYSKYAKKLLIESNIANNQKIDVVGCSRLGESFSYKKLKPKNQIGWSYSIGLDLQLAKNTGLYLRHRWMKYQDLNFSMDHYQGTETTVELKIFF